MQNKKVEKMLDDLDKCVELLRKKLDTMILQETIDDFNL